MESAKIQLSADELQLLENSAWILTKNSIIEKVYQLFGQVALQFQEHITGQAAVLPEAVVSSTPKISRGEQYEGLPYVMLDYPRLFGKDDVLAIRSLFWWGNFFSITLHVKGQWQRTVAEKIILHYDELQKAGFEISMGEDEWRHDFRTDNYQQLDNIGAQATATLLHSKSFVKLSVKVNFSQWCEMEKLLSDFFLLLVKTIAT